MENGPQKDYPLCQIYLKDIPSSMGSFGKMIVTLLNYNYIVNISVLSGQLKERFSFERIQWTKWDVEQFTIPNIVLADPEVSENLKQKPDLLLTNEVVNKIINKQLLT